MGDKILMNIEHFFLVRRINIEHLKLAYLRFPFYFRTKIYFLFSILASHLSGYPHLI